MKRPNTLLINALFAIFTIIIVRCELPNVHSENEISTGEIFNVDFMISRDTCSKICAISFTNTSTNATDFEWDFGDGSPLSSEENPQHSYDAVGNYEVTLTAKSLSDNTKDNFQNKNVVVTIPTFNKTIIASAGIDKGYGLLASFDGRYICIGETADGSQGGQDVVIVKIDELGSKIFSNTYGAVQDDAGFSISEDSENNLIATGYTTTDRTDILFLKTLPDGSIITSKSYQIGRPASGRDIIAAPNDRFTMVGIANLCGTSGLCDHMAFFQINSQGEPISEVLDAFGSGNNTQGFAVINTGAELIAAGHEFDNNGEQLDIILMRMPFNEDFPTETMQFQELGNQSAKDMIALSGNRTLVVGNTENNANGPEDIYWMIIDNATFNKLQEGTIGGAGSDRANAIAATSDGGFIITGETNSFGSNGLDIYLVKIDQNLNVQWQRNFGGSNDDSGQDVIATSDGGYLLTGWSDKDNNVNDTDMVLIKTDSRGRVY